MRGIQQLNNPMSIKIIYSLSVSCCPPSTSLDDVKCVGVAGRIALRMDGMSVSSSFSPSFLFPMSCHLMTSVSVILLGI